ncbi:MAG: NAD(P)H-hydrate dehydratase [Actinomycetaceae bacterium]|nr:NAD(P)H-hydrate dehydratase [Actinomycetaceae bacterium]MDY5854628.1 NAD(P)H-hydrate dehydratase [Arcanobacterium sp.]
MKRAYVVEDVRRAEQPLLDAGVPLMDQAAYALAGAVVRHIRESGLRIPGSTLLALVGAGNNGGDALFAAAYLARRGMSVVAACHGAVHEAGRASAVRAGVRILADPSPQELARAGAAAGVWLDGMLGIGSRGALREPLSTWARVLTGVRDHSAAEPYVIAVDVPSGVGVDDGTLPGAVIKADATVTMGAAKRALYLPPASHMAGQIIEVPLGFEQYLPAEPALASLTDSDVRDLWIVPGPHDHKYTRGVLGVLAGSHTYPGAGMLCVGAARSMGIGMIRYRGEASGIVERYPDVVRAEGAVQAWTIGSGLDDLREASRILQQAITHATPVVLDASAIALVHHDDVPSTVVITPHEGELAALLQARGESLSREDIHQAPARAARLAATLTGATVVLKGSVNVIAGPHGPLYAQGGAPAWLATAGAGDVLAGVLGAFLASYGDDIESWGEGRGIPGQLAAAACHVHALAAQLAARACDGRLGRPVTASAVVAALSEAIFIILNPQF